jgi:beta-glucanase (GH16 family)
VGLDGCPHDKAVGAQIVDIDFRKGASSFFKAADGTDLKYDSGLGAVFTINKETDAPTITSNQYIFFGQVDVTVRASQGVGVVTSFVLQSDDLDEIDWEWLGGDATQVQTNYFSKGCTDTYDRGGFSPVSDPINNFHTYTIRWTPEKLDWIIDGAVVRTLTNSGLSGCSGYPQTPMQIKLGTWVGGRSDAPEGTIQWAGGLTDFSKAPFYGYYQSIRIQDYMGGQGATSASEYYYGDKSGTWQSIKIVNGSSTGSATIASSTTTTTKPTTTAKPTTTSSTSKHTSTATTLTTVSPTRIATNNGTATTSPAGSSDKPTATTATTVPTASQTGAAVKVAGNLVAAGAAALLGFLAL